LLNAPNGQKSDSAQPQSAQKKEQQES